LPILGSGACLPAAAFLRAARGFLAGAEAADPRYTLIFEDIGWLSAGWSITEKLGSSSSELLLERGAADAFASGISSSSSSLILIRRLGVGCFNVEADLPFVMLSSLSSDSTLWRIICCCCEVGVTGCKYLSIVCCFDGDLIIVSQLFTSLFSSQFQTMT
jgi:hypothetical protein